MVENLLMKKSTAKIARTSQMANQHPEYCQTTPSIRSSCPQSSYRNLAPHYPTMTYPIEDLLSPHLMNPISTQQGWELVNRQTPTLPVARVENPCYWSRVHWQPAAPSPHYYIGFVTNSLDLSKIRGHTSMNQALIILQSKNTLTIKTLGTRLIIQDCKTPLIL
jgi:hypothetical protein